MEHFKGYKFRIYPTEDQKESFAKTFGCSRKVYNLILESFTQGKPISTNQLQAYKDEFSYLNEVDPYALQSAYKHITSAINLFKRKKTKHKPRFKSKNNHRQSYKTSNQKEIKLLNQDYIQIPNLSTPLKIKVHRKPQGPILSIVISKHASGRYYLSMVCKETIRIRPKTNKAVGIDLGIQDFAVFSTGQKIDNHYFTKKKKQKLAREQRKLSRRRAQAIAKGIDLYDAKNYQKQKKVVARIHEKTTNQRKYFLDYLTTMIINNHDVICVEDLNIQDLKRNSKLSGQISDVSWNAFIQKLKYKAKWYGKKVVVVDRYFPSSQICSHCNYRDTKKPLTVREWQCPNCLSILDRDINASRNILFEGCRLAGIKLK